MVAGSRRSTKFSPKQLHGEKGFGSFVFELSFKRPSNESNNLKVSSYQQRKQAHAHTHTHTYILKVENYGLFCGHTEDLSLGDSLSIALKNCSEEVRERVG